MKEKKQRASWYIAATHYLTAGFAMPILIGLAFAAIIVLFKIKIEVGIISISISLALRILAIWLGVMYSARYITKTYIIKNRNSIISSATMYLAVFSLGYTGIQLISYKITTTGAIYNAVETIIAAFLFYIFSKKYIKEDAEIIASAPQTQNQFDGYQTPPQK